MRQQATTSATPLPTNNVWYHLAGTYDCSEVLLYVGGTKYSSQCSGKITTNDEDVRIGDIGNDEFHGIIDEVRIWNRALSENEVQALATYGLGS